MKQRKLLTAGEVDALYAELDRRLHGMVPQTQPEIAARILDLVADREAGLRQYADVIKTDPTLSGRLLRLANSAFFAQREPVTNLDRACVLLGLERIKATALGFYLARSVNTGPDDALARRVWGEGVYRACLASELSRHLCPGYSAEAFCVGLMLDSGLPILVRLLGDRATAIYGAESLPPKQFKAEFETLPCTHVDVVAMLARRWKLPDLLAKPIERHHLAPPEGARAEPVYLLHRISYYVGALQLNDDSIPDRPAPLQVTAQKVLGLGPDQLAGIIRRSAGEYAAMTEMFREVADSIGDMSEMADRVQRQLVDMVDSTMMLEFRDHTRQTTGAFEVGDRRIEIELDRQGLAIAYLLDAEGERFLSHSFTPGRARAADLLEALGVEPPASSCITDLDAYMRSIAA
jgi:HD-like signal output (HDOD) protein